MVERAYAIFDTALGRCGIIWSSTGVIAVQLPEAREIDTRRRIFQVHPEAREQRPSENAELAIEGITGLLQGSDPDFSDVSLDAGGVPGFNQRVYEFVCTIPRGETRTYAEVAKALEGAVPDLAARQIIDEAMVPRFRQDDFAGGLPAAIDMLVARVSGEPLPAPQQRRQAGGGAAGFNGFDMAIFLFFAVPIAGSVLRGIFGRPLGSKLTGGGVLVRLTPTPGDKNPNWLLLKEKDSSVDTEIEDGSAISVRYARQLSVEVDG